MSIKEELHRLVDLMPEEHEAAAAERLRDLVEGARPRAWSLEDRAEWDALVGRIRDRIPAGVTADEIEMEISRASDEARQERITRWKHPHGA